METRMDSHVLDDLFKPAGGPSNLGLALDTPATPVDSDALPHRPLVLSANDGRSSQPRRSSPVGGGGDIPPAGVDQPTSRSAGDEQLPIADGAPVEALPVVDSLPVFDSVPVLYSLPLVGDLLAVAPVGAGPVTLPIFDSLPAVGGLL
jgi:hypothetical protein